MNGSDLNQQKWPVEIQTSAPSTLPVQKDVRLQQVMALWIGGEVYRRLLNRILPRLINRMGYSAIASYSAVQSMYALPVFLLTAAGVVFAVCSYGKGEAHRRRMAGIASGVTSGILLLCCLLWLAAPSFCVSFLLGRAEAKIMDEGSILFRWSATSTLAFSGITAAVGFAVKRKSLLLIALADAGALLLSLFVAFMSVHVLHFSLAGIGIAMGILPPVTLLLPVLGGFGPEASIPASAGVTSVHSASARMFCPSCGMQLPAADGKRFCDQCTAELKEAAPQAAMVQTTCSAATQQDARSGGFATLGFFFPVVGLVLYLVWKDSFPLKSRSAGKGALIGAIVRLSLTAILYAIDFILLAGVF